MPDHARHWTHFVRLDEDPIALDASDDGARDAAGLLSAGRRLAARALSSPPTITAVLLTASVVGAAGTFFWMLPTTGRNVGHAPAAVTSQMALSQVDYRTVRPAAPDAVREPLMVPRVVTGLALAAGETWSRLLTVMPEPDAMAQAPVAEVASDLPAPAINAAAGPVAPTSKRVVYLVDASGSLLDSLPQVIEWLGENLGELDRQQQFTILFYQQRQVLEVPPAGLKSASFTTKASAWNWIQPEAGNVFPQGRSNLIAAVEAAMAYDPHDLVLLADDSFARSMSASRDEEASTILADVGRALGGRDVRVHAVQFFYRDEAGALEALADCFDGRYEFVQGEHPTAAAPTPIDPLLAPLIH